MKKFFLTAAAVSSLISSSAFADTTSPSDEMGIYVRPNIGMSWYLGNMMKADPSSSSDKKSDSTDKKAETNSAIGNFSHNHIGNMNFMVGAGYKFNDMFSVGISSGFKLSSMSLKTNAYNAFNVKYVSSIVDMGSFQQIIKGWKEGTPKNVMNSGETFGSYTVTAEGGATADAEDVMTFAWVAETDGKQADAAKAIAGFMESNKDFAEAKFSMNAIPLYLNVTASYEVMPSLSLFADLGIGAQVAMPKTSLKLNMNVLKNFMGDEGKKHADAAKTLMEQYGSSQDEKRPQGKVTEAQERPAVEADDINNIAAAAAVPPKSKVGDAVKATADVADAVAYSNDPMMDFASNVQDVINGTVKDVTLDVDYAKKFLFAGELSLGASYSFGPVSTFAAVTASFRQGADEMEVSAVKNQNLQNSASKIQKGSKTRMNMPNAYELGWKLGLDVSF